MADEFAIEDPAPIGDADVDMAGAEVVEVVEADTGATAIVIDDVDVTAVEDSLPQGAEETPSRITFLDYLKSPIIELLVGDGGETTLLTAHQALLVQSPFFEEACSKFSDAATTRRIDLPNENLDAVGCFLEWVYTGEYFPQRIDGTRGLVRDADMPEIDPDGDQLLKHARVYTLADKLGLSVLKSLAHSKIHCVNSSARGEIAYARYVYATTPKEDVTIRKPVASFWAQRSHVLRKEAEQEFMQLCLEYPQFGFDVLSRVLDEKAKRDEAKSSSQGTPATSRKRQRQTQI